MSADDSLIRAPMLRSERLGLVGRCDHLLRVGDVSVPVEQKPSERRFQQSHILQVGALCLLVEDVYAVRPPYGVVVLADGSQARVTFSEELERGVVGTMAEMRRLHASGVAPGPAHSPPSPSPQLTRGARSTTTAEFTVLEWGSNA